MDPTQDAAGGRTPSGADDEGVTDAAPAAGGSGGAGGEEVPDYDVLSTVDRRHYMLKKLLGHGGHGRIFSARDRRLGRDVAIKQLLVDALPESLRFEREARITARLQHPGIVAVYEAGRFSTGEVFYAMRQIAGRSLDVATAETAGFPERLALLPRLIDAAEAIAYAHSLRIVHRDLKPENILLGPFGETVVIDWGLAKDLAGNAPELPTGAWSPTGAPNLSMFGEIMGTPVNMAPEQAKAREVDERADVYAFGTILYHVLGGRPAYEADDAWEILEKVRSGPPPDLATVQPDVPVDLLAIVRKAMARDPADRYPSARELVEELRRFQTGQLVAARHYSWLDRSRRWFGRNRGIVAMAVLAAAVVVATATISVRRIVTERDRARIEQERAIARADELTLVQARGWMDRDPATALSWLALLSPGSSRWQAARTIAADALSRGIPRVLRGHDGPVLHAAASADGRTIVTASADRTLWVWDTRSWTGQKLQGHLALVGRVAISADGSVAASASHDGTAGVHALQGGASHVLRGHVGPVLDVAISPDATQVATAGQDGTLRLWSVTGELHRTFEGHGRAVGRVAFTPDGATLVSAGDDGSVRLWPLAPGSPPKSWQAHQGRAACLAIDASSGAIASGGEDGAVWLRPGGDDAEPVMLLGHESRVLSVAFSHDGRNLASGGEDRTVRIWDAAPGASTRESRVLRGHDRLVSSVAFSADGRSVASASHDSTVRVWTLATGKSRVLRGHDLWIHHVDFTAAGLLSTGADKTVRIWALGDDGGHVLSGHEDRVARLGFWPDARVLASADQRNVVRLWDVGSGRELQSIDLGGTLLHLAPDGRAAVLMGIDGGLRVTRFSEGARSDRPPMTDHRGDVLVAALAPSGEVVASAGFEGEIWIWSANTGKGRLLPERCPGATDATFSPDGRTLLLGGGDFALHRYAVATGAHDAFQGHSNIVKEILFSPDGELVATASIDGKARLWDLARGTSELVPGHDGTINALAFSPRGDLLASVGSDRRVCLLDLATRKGRTLTGHRDMVWSVAFSPDGTTLASASSDATVRLWDVGSGESRALVGHEGRVWEVAFSPTGTLLASCAKEPTVRIWRDDLPRDPELLRARVLELAPPGGLDEAALVGLR